MTTLMIFNTIMTGLMFCWWNNKDKLNAFVRVIWFSLFVANTIFTLKLLNFI